MRVSLARKPSWQLPRGFAELGLDDAETWDLLAELVRIVRQQGAVSMPEGVAANDEAFDPRRGPIYVRGTGPEPKRKVISWLPARGVNRRLDYMAAIACRARQQGKAGGSPGRVLGVPEETARWVARVEQRCEARCALPGGSHVAAAGAC